jgi:hypothetical protein
MLIGITFTIIFTSFALAMFNKIVTAGKRLIQSHQVTATLVMTPTTLEWFHQPVLAYRYVIISGVGMLIGCGLLLQDCSAIGFRYLVEVQISHEG